MRKKAKNGRKVLEEALRQNFRTYYRHFSDSEEELYLGEDDKDDMDRPIHRSKNPFVSYFNTKGMRVAGLAAALLIVFGCSMTVSAIRTPVISFCVNTYETFTELFFDESDIEKAPQTIETVYTLGYVPEGYVEKSYNITDSLTHIVWSNEKNQQIVFRQRTLKGSATIDNENTNWNVIDGTQIKYMSVGTIRDYFWSSDEYFFYLKIPDSISHDTALDLIQSIKIK